MRLILLIVITAAFMATVTFGPVYYFAIFCGLLTIFVSWPLEWRRLLFERPLFFRRQFSGVAIFAIGIFVVFNVGLRALLTGFAALFTFPDVDNIEKMSNSLPDLKGLAQAMQADLAWTFIIIALTLIASAALLVFGDRFGQIKGARWTYFRLPLYIGILYSALIVTISDLSVEQSKERVRTSGALSFEAGPILPSPSPEQAGAALRAVFGSYLDNDGQAAYLDDLRVAYLEALENNRGLRDAASDLNEASEFFTQPYEEFLLLAEQDGVCRYVGGEYKPDAILGFGEVRGLKPRHEDVPGQNFIGIKVLARHLQNVRDFENFVWRTSSCGFRKGQEWCRDHPRLAADYGCSDPTTEIEAARRRMANAEETVTDVVDSQPPKSPDEIVELTPANGLVLISLLDAFTHDRLTEVIDASAIAILDELRGEMSPIRRVQRERSMERQNTSSSFGYPAWLSSSVCEEASAHQWCRSWARQALRIIISPYVLQGVVLSLFITIFLMLFPRKDQKPLPINWSKINGDVWRFGPFSTKRSRQTDHSSTDV